MNLRKKWVHNGDVPQRDVLVEAGLADALHAALPGLADALAVPLRPEEAAGAVDDELLGGTHPDGPLRRLLHVDVLVQDVRYYSVLSLVRIGVAFSKLHVDSCRSLSVYVMVPHN